MKRNFLFVFTFLSFALAAYGQVSQPVIKTYEIGDTIPDFVFTYFRGGKRYDKKASDLYKQGGLIINFWATWCVPCISALPRLDSLQRTYRSHVNIVCFTFQDSMVVSTFFEEHPQLKPRYLKIVTNDTFLYKGFPHRAIPHNAWVDKNGVVRAVTDDEDINGKNIESFIGGKDFNFTLKADDMFFDYNKPLDVKSNKFIYRSIITKYRPDIGNGGAIMQWNKTHSLVTRYLDWNGNITDFLWKAYHPESGLVNFKLIELHVTDSTRFLYPGLIENLYKTTKYKNRRQWVEANTYCYELCIPKGVKEKLFCSYIKQDIERYFNITSWIKDKKIPCWVITGQPDKHIFKRSTIRKPWLQLTGNTKDSATLIVRHHSLIDIMNFFLNRNSYDPYVNGTGINYPIDMTLQFTHLKGGSVSIDQLKKKLEQYGFMFKKEIKLYPVLTISDKR